MGGHSSVEFVCVFNLAAPSSIPEQNVYYDISHELIDTIKCISLVQKTKIENIPIGYPLTQVCVSLWPTYVEQFLRPRYVSNSIDHRGAHRESN